MSALFLDPSSRDQRRTLISQHPIQIGLDFIDVVSNQNTPALILYFIPADDAVGAKVVVPPSITPANVRLTTRTGASDLQVTGEISRTETTITLSLQRGNETTDATVYTLELINLPNLDHFFSQSSFTLATNDISEFDPVASILQRLVPSEPVEIDYLARDYASLRQLMLDRLSVLMPQWKERHPADLGTVLVEVLAYAGDRLSYYQDAVATEAYLGTARRRISVKRHARLLDYALHEGCNARVWVQIQIKPSDDKKPVPIPGGTGLLTYTARAFAALEPGSTEHRQAIAQTPEQFETLHPINAISDHNELLIYTWGARECVLSQGATTTTLKGRFSHLKPGDVVIFEEVLGTRSEPQAKANPTRRHAVRLLRVEAQRNDPLSYQTGTGTLSAEGETVTGTGTSFRTELAAGGTLRIAGQIAIIHTILSDTELIIQPGFTSDFQAGTPFQVPQGLTEITWATADALPFSMTVATQLGTTVVDGMTVARGNVVLAEHGQRIWDEPLPPVPATGRYRPRLQYPNLTYAVPYHHAGAVGRSAGEAIAQDVRQAVPMLNLHEEKIGQVTIPISAPNPSPSPSRTWRQGETWWAQPDLLKSDRFSRDFVVEVESDGVASLRFGDGVRGKQPQEDIHLHATYRIGKGAQGNVGADAIAHILVEGAICDRILAVRNPLPAQGGMDAEPLEQVRLYAPQAFKTDQLRCVTPNDYQRVAERHPDVRQAAATLRWTGSWYTAFIAVKRQGDRPVDSAFRAELLQFMERYRVAGYSLEILSPRFVALEIALVVKVAAGYFASTVKQLLLETFSNVDLPNGQRGFFHPDRFTFGQPVYLSQIVQTAMQVPGVIGVYLPSQFSSDPPLPPTQQPRFQRWGASPRDELNQGKIDIAPLEIARLDNNASAPERGKIEFTLEGGL
jgi:hypothetical protein